MGPMSETDFRVTSNATSASVCCQAWVCENRAGVSFEKLAELKIREAMEAGEFDRLPNAGARIDLDGYFALPPHLRMAYSVLKSANCLPEEVLLLNDVAALESRLAGILDPATRERLTASLHDLRLRLAIALDRMKAEARAAKSRL
jgi:hypothetical protein